MIEAYQENTYLSNNLFFTLERIWALFLFAYFYSCQKIEKYGDIDRANIITLLSSEILNLEE